MTMNISSSCPPGSQEFTSKNVMPTAVALDVVPQPYPHQVGGHGFIAKSGVGGRVLKPLAEKKVTERELRFYRTINDKDFPEHLRWLRDFTAAFYGRKELHIECPNDKENGEPLEGDVIIKKAKSLSGGVDEEGFRKGRAASRWEGTARSAGSQVKRWHIGGVNDGRREVSRDVEGDTEDSEEDNGDVFNVSIPESELNSTSDIPVLTLSESGEGSERTRRRMRWRNDTEGTRASVKESVDISPWAIKMNEKLRTRTHADLKAVPRFYVELEDLACVYRYPCVMDCKIGIRHYDDDASPEKRRRHIHKARTTTSGSMGLRITGMQVFRRNGEYLFRDKYYGRNLKDKDLVPELMCFFSDGRKVRLDVLDPILAKLRVLSKHMEKQIRFKFYSSSLLLTYDGDDTRPPRPNLKMIDFAHTQSSHGETDEGYNFGLRNFISLLEQGRAEALTQTA